MSRISRFLSTLGSVLTAFAICTQSSSAQWDLQPPSTKIARTSGLTGSLSPRIISAGDLGRAPRSDVMEGVSLLLRQSAAQVDSLQTLLLKQQIPGDSDYHKWLAPAKYADLFGSDQSSLATVTAWLEEEGFTDISVDASRTSLRFDGTIAQIEDAFSTELHRYNVNGRVMIAAAREPKVPEAVERYVQGFRNLDEFQPQAQLASVRAAPKAEWDSGDSATHFVAPSDVTHLYNFTAVLSAGYTGTGQQIAIIGQSAIEPADIDHFRAAAGLGLRRLTLVLVPATGASVRKAEDELESDIDLEYAGAIARDSDLTLVYTGSEPNHNVFDALAYAVYEDIAPILSISYGVCETQLSESDRTLIERVLMQASAQGQTVIAASGDAGATACETPDARSNGVAQHGLAVWYPASSPNVTAIGGTMFDDAGSTSSWAEVNTDGGSAESYIAEEGWNESHASTQATLLGSGGGASAIFPKPSWQTGRGVPNDGRRDVPDISFDAGFHHDGYLLCSGDSAVPVKGSCEHGFFDSSGLQLVVSGGTSFGAPIAAGMVALLNQSIGAKRIGNLSPILYSLAEKNGGAFHDIIRGDNRESCMPGSQDCGPDDMEGFLAGVGYDQVTGLGTPDVGQLAGALALVTSIAVERPSIKLRELDSVVIAGTGAHIIAIVSDIANLGGEIQFSVDGSDSDPAIPVQGATVTFISPALSPGLHTISAVFTTFSGRTASSALMIQALASPPPIRAFTLSSSSLPAPFSGMAAFSITVHASEFYSGRVTFAASSANADLASNGCYTIQEVDIQASASAQSSLLVAYSQAACAKLASTQATNVLRFDQSASLSTVGSARQGALKRRAPSGYRFAAGLIEACGVLLLTGVRRPTKCGAAALIACLNICTFATGCGVKVNTGAVTAGSYSLVITGEDSKYSPSKASVEINFAAK